MLLYTILKGVGLVCVNFATFILNCYKVIDNPHFYITKV
jgi:hypothetical protein